MALAFKRLICAGGSAKNIYPGEVKRFQQITLVATLNMGMLADGFGRRKVVVMPQSTSVLRI